MTLPRIPANESTAKKVAEDLSNPNSESAAWSPPSIGALIRAAGASGLTNGSRDSIVGSLARGGSADPGGFSAYNRAAKEVVTAQALEVKRDNRLREFERHQQEVFQRERDEKIKKEKQKEEALELQRRAVAASEATLKAAVEAERARTASAEADAAFARNEAAFARAEADDARSKARMNLYFAAGSFVVAVLALAYALYP